MCQGIDPAAPQNVFVYVHASSFHKWGGGRVDAPRGGTKASQTVLVVRLPRLTTRMGGDVPGVDLGASQIDV